MALPANPTHPQSHPCSTLVYPRRPPPPHPTRRKTDGQQTDAQRRQRRRSPSSLHLAPVPDLPTPSAPWDCLGLASHGDFYGTQTRRRRDLSASSPTPDTIPNHGQAPSLIPSTFSSCTSGSLGLQYQPTPKTKIPFNPPTSEKSRTTVPCGPSCVALVSSMPFPAGATRFPTAHVAPAPQGRGDFGGCP